MYRSLPLSATAAGKTEDWESKLEIQKIILRWSGHVESMNEKMLPEEIHDVEVNEYVGRGRPIREYTDQIAI